MYAPFWQEDMFNGERGGGGGLYFEARRGRNFIPPPSSYPPTHYQGYGYSLFCSHSPRCLKAPLWQYFEEAFCAPKAQLKWYSFKGFPLIALIALVASFFHSTPGLDHIRRVFSGVGVVVYKIWPPIIWLFPGDSRGFGSDRKALPLGVFCSWLLPETRLQSRSGFYPSQHSSS